MYFNEVFGSHPSTIRFHCPLKSTPDSRTRLDEALGEALAEMDLVTRTWKLPDAKLDAEQPADKFARRLTEATYLGRERPALLHYDTDHDRLNVTVLLDAHHGDTEAWALALVEALRAAFGKEASAQFHVLTSSQLGFDTEAINVQPLALDVAAHYNDDFAPVHADIRAALGAERSGLILLHGKPGTGKTSYIKHLIAEFPDRKFIFVPNDLVEVLLKPDFVSFMITQRSAILVIEDAEKVIQSRETSQQASVVSTILQLTDGLFSDYLSLKVVCTFNTDVSRIDQALYRKGRLIAFYEFGALSQNKSRALLADIGAGELAESAGRMTLAEIYNHDARAYGQPENKKIGFASLILLALTFLGASGLAAQSPLDALLGTWAGDIAVYAPGAPVREVPMRLHFAPRDAGDSTYAYQLTYLLPGAAPDVRAYVLRTRDAAAGAYVLDELNGISIPTYFLGGALVSRFGVMGSDLLTSIQRRGDHLAFAIAVSSEEATVTGDTIVQGDTIPPVRVYPMVVRQEALLRRE